MFSYGILTTIVSMFVMLLIGKEVLKVKSIPTVSISTLEVGELDNPRSAMSVLSRDGMSLKLPLTIVFLTRHQVVI
jgi:hypothetical protein